MNSLKNLLVIAVLGAVGYGIYVSLARNNADNGQPPGVAEGWPTVPKVELPSTNSTSPGSSLAVNVTPGTPVGTAGSRPGGMTLPLAPPSIVGPSSNPNPPAAAPAAMPTTLLPSGSASANPPATSPANPAVTLGTPMPPDALSSAPPANSVTPAGSPTQPANPVRSPLAAAPPANPAPAATNPDTAFLQSKFAALMDAVRKSLDEGKLAEAHLALSNLYGNSDLPADQAKQISELLDRLAGTVIYSRKHYLEPAYVTQPGDTLEKVSQKYSVPWQLLAKINGLIAPDAPNTDTSTKDLPLPIGMQLKVLRGPFEAIVRLDRHELTLMLQNRYAGRFAIGVGRDQPKLDGNYTVREKTLNPSYYGPDGVTLNANDPKNPLGPAWIGLSDRIGIHGASDPQSIGRDDNRGTICVGNHDLQDIYGILSVGSRVTVLR
jgi:hypothetical protein